MEKQMKTDGIMGQMIYTGRNPCKKALAIFMVLWAESQRDAAQTQSDLWSSDFRDLSEYRNKTEGTQYGFWWWWWWWWWLWSRVWRKNIMGEINNKQVGMEFVGNFGVKHSIANEGVQDAVRFNIFTIVQIQDACINMLIVSTVIEQWSSW